MKTALGGNISVALSSSGKAMKVMKRNILHVVPHEKKGWRINMPEKGDKIFATKKEAVKEAISIARTSQPSQLVIHGRDGKIQEERTYGRDPYPPRG